MELKEFIKNTLTEIAAGINEANKSLRSEANSTDYFELQAHGARNENYIVFDVAVSSSDKDTVAGKGGIKVLGMGVGLQSGAEVQTMNVSRIKFSVKVTHNLK